MKPVARFFKEIQHFDAPRVLELGTKRSRPDVPTHRGEELRQWNLCVEHVKSDFEAGADVDVVADAHRLAEVFGAESFDCVFAASVFEHLARPWEAAKEIIAVLRPGGLAYISTHQTFPVHGYPSDYFRFTLEGLKSLFAGAEVLEAEYEFPCRVTPTDPINSWDTNHQAWLNVSILVQRAHKRVTDNSATKNGHYTRRRMYERYQEIPPLEGEILAISGLPPFRIAPGARVTSTKYPEVNVLNLPYNDETFDAVMAEQVIEHVAGNPFDAAAEMLRVLKPGGLIHCSAPLIYPIHHSAEWGDYWRFTPDGLRLLFPKCDVIQCEGWGSKEALHTAFCDGRAFEYFETVPQSDGAHLIHVWFIGRKQRPQ